MRSIYLICNSFVWLIKRIICLYLFPKGNAYIDLHPNIIIRIACTQNRTQFVLNVEKKKSGFGPPEMRFIGNHRKLENIWKYFSKIPNRLPQIIYSPLPTYTYLNNAKCYLRSAFRFCIVNGSLLIVLHIYFIFPTTTRTWHLHCTYRSHFLNVNIIVRLWMSSCAYLINLSDIKLASKEFLFFSFLYLGLKFFFVSKRK